MVKVEGETDGMTSLSQLECGPLSTISPDNSFIVVGHDSLPSSEDLSSVIHVNHTPPLSLSNPLRTSSTGDNGQPMTASLLSSSYVEPKDMQQRLDLVLQENLELKETLHQNNLAMRQQMETLTAWQNEVAKVQHSHSQKFQQTKELVIKLKAENSELRRHIENLQETGGDGRNTDRKNPGTVGAEVDEVSLLEDRQRIVQTIENFEKVFKLEQQCDHLLEENANLRKHCEELSYQAAKSEELSKLVQQLTHKLETSERGRRQLEFDLEKAMYAHTDNHLIKLGNENCALRSTLVEQNKEIESLKKKLEEGNRKQQESNDCNVESALPEAGPSEDHYKDRLDAAKTELELLRQQFEEAQVSIVAREDSLAQKSKRIEELVQKLANMEKKLEAIPLLQAQVEVYQADFHAEREARQLAESKNDQLKRMHRLSQLQSGEPQNDLSEVCRNPQKNRIENVSPHLCPVCDADFPDVPKLERHVQECLEQNCG